MTLTAPAPRAGSRSSREATPPRPDPVLAVALEWIERHCVVPDGFRRGAPFRAYDFQVVYIGNFYRVRADATWDPAAPVLAPAFVYRHGLLVGPQKLGKDPIIAAQVCLEADGPALFGGWAGPDEGYVCAEHGCRCGWEYPYDAGEPRGMPWPTALIQVAAYSQKATDNTYDALRPMIELGPLADRIPKTGEDFIRLPNGGRIDTVTSESRSRLGNRVTHVSAGELGIWTQANGMTKVFDTMSRGVAAMGGRVSGTTNAWDPAEQSVAQQEYESPARDIYRQFTHPPSGLSFRNKDERRRILRAVYPSDVRRENGGHVDLDGIEAEAAALVVKDYPQAARFYGNQLIAGAGKAFDPEAWAALGDPDHVVPDGALITLGFDGSKSDDTTALVACEVETGYAWPVDIWDPDEHGGRIPTDAVSAAVDAAFERWSVCRLYADPPYWVDAIAEWSGRFGDKVVHEWATYRNAPMGWAVRSLATAIADGRLRHSGDPRLAAHVGNAFKRQLLVRDAEGEPLWALQKETPKSRLKIDAATALVLAWEARSDAIADGVRPSRSIYEDMAPLVLGR